MIGPMPNERPRSLDAIMRQMRWKPHVPGAPSVSGKVCDNSRAGDLL